MCVEAQLVGEQPRSPHTHLFGSQWPLRAIQEHTRRRGQCFESHIHSDRNPENYSQYTKEIEHLSGFQLAAKASEGGARTWPPKRSAISN